MIRLPSLFFVAFIAVFSHAFDIFEAIENNSTQDVRTAIDNGVDVNIKDKDGMTPLIHAIFENDLDIAELLLDSGADANLVAPELPIFIAISLGNVDMVEMLIDKGAVWQDIRDSNGKTPLMIASLLDSSDMFEYILRLGSDINAQDNEGRNALMYACDAQKNKHVLLLIASGIDVNAVDYHGNTALMFAVVDTPNSETIVKMLLDAGADKNIENSDGDTALDIAKQNNASKVIALLSKDSNGATNKHANNDIDIDDLPTFYEIIRSGDYKTFNQYIKLGVDINGRANGDDTPLIVAAANGQLQMTKDLVSLGADIEAQNDISATPLVLASFHGYKEIVKFLLDSGADVNAVGKEDNWSALMSAASNGDVEIAQMLLDAGADKNIENSDGDIALDIAKRDGSTKVVELLSDGKVQSSFNKESFRSAVINGDLETLKQFLDDGVDVDTLIHYDDANSTPLLVASQLGYVNLVELLIDRKANLDFINNNGDSPLIMAAYKGKKWVVSLLIEAGAKIDIRDRASSATPLMIASYQNYYDIVDMLIDSKADINAVDMEGWTSLMSAAAAGNLDIIELLIDSAADVNLVNGDGDSALDIAKDKAYDMIKNAGGKPAREISRF